jgi:carbonic anhydrase
MIPGSLDGPVAGNGIGGDVLGSLRYAMEHLRDSLRLVVVLGHSGCGAILTAVDIFLEPGGYLPLLANHALRGVLDRQLIVVQATARRLTSVFGADVTRHKRYREALIEASVVTNAALSAYTIQEELRGTGPSRRLRRVSPGKPNHLGTRREDGWGNWPRSPSGKSRVIR